MTEYFTGILRLGTQFRRASLGQNSAGAGTDYADDIIYFAPSNLGPIFSITPTSGHATGAIPITATGILTEWTTSNPFSITGGGSFASIANYARISDTSATFDLVLTSLGGTVTIYDSFSDSSKTYSAAAVVPSKPLNVVITDLHDGTIRVVFDPPADAGGAAITSYAATTSSGGFNNSGSASPIIISGINKGVSQHVNVVATNSVGAGATSDNSNDITPVTVPGPPTSLIATATATLGQATVAFTAPADNGGSAVIGYTVTAIPSVGTDSEAGSTDLTHTITGLLHATSYTFTAVATNSYETSIASVVSNAITTKGFRIVPTGTSVIGVVSVTATGFLTNWTTNPFAVDSGPGSISNYSNIDGDSATFDLTVSAINGVPIIISDSDSGSTASFSTRLPGSPGGFAPGRSRRGGRGRRRN